ncbi:hypothetical protein LCGC14_1142060 [marine sediment metagenome]|uniref:Uncharacterized protein n=1 Tax=marine sediment metagenome TaxID=412755 RepID=A0A0F9Q3R0_9ZZZZ
MANNFQRFNRSFQESFQRARQIELQRQREERFERQLTVNAQFQQSQLNTQREQFAQRERRLTGQAGISADIREREFGLSERRVELAEAQFGRSEQFNLPPKLEFLGRLSKRGVPAKIIGDIDPLIPDDATAEESPVFFEVAQKLPFFQQESFFTFGLGEGFRERIKRPNVSQEEVAPEFRRFLQETNFASRPPGEQATILRSFEESLGINISGDDPKTAVPRDEVEFDLQSPFFQEIIKAERAKATQPAPTSPTERKQEGESIADFIRRTQ